MRGVNGDVRAVNNTLETINAAATAIASAENRVPQPTVQKKTWSNFWSISFCFGYHKKRKRIGHAVLVPEAAPPRTDASAAENLPQATTITLPFLAPPSSPASFLQSEPPSIAQSPAGIPFTSMSASMYSPVGPSSIFAIGPYAHETQLVSPPVFSTFTTEPSTAPFTPPPESVHLTTPSSPEVPFAQLLDPSLRNGEICQRYPVSNYDFQSYQFHPGSPVGQLISPSSGISVSGTSSPFPDGEFPADSSNILEFRTGEPPKLLNLDKLFIYEWGSRQGSGSLTPDSLRPKSQDDLLPNRWLSEVALHPRPVKGSGSDNTGVDHRVSFELTAEDALRCVQNKPVALAKAESTSQNDTAMAETEKNSRETARVNQCHVAETSNGAPHEASANGKEAAHHHQKHPSITLSSIKEFNFDNADGGDSHKPNIVSDWWANEKVVEKEGGSSKNWAFFPMVQPGVS
ncbi:Hydroxyproline-rich glycoprotein family protein [Quillaja saponaria]|uniref:Hydroxyproline-rich glycoprotein family protein n=1 Tax=Quillaja saponaria TaxID=32244 RepID=A0AAD7L6I1_QUISA|nr:Hydroxyproline-rich glycoprotein family protein [Quillaja saponaria]